LTLYFSGLVYVRARNANIIALIQANSNRTKIITQSKIFGEYEMRLKVVLEPSDEGGYTVYVPSLPGCISEGDTIDEALANIGEAVELYLEPVEDDWIIAKGAMVQELVV